MIPGFGPNWMVETIFLVMPVSWVFAIFMEHRSIVHTVPTFGAPLYSPYSRNLDLGKNTS